MSVLPRATTTEFTYGPSVLFSTSMKCQASSVGVKSTKGR